MEMTLEVASRTSNQRASASQAEIPAVVYGPKHASQSLLVDKQRFERLFHQAGESTIITLTGIGEPLEVLVHDVAFDAARGGVVHVDFYAIERGKELTTKVALAFVGEAPAQREGTVVKAMQEVEVTCRPSVLPAQIDVDLTKLTTADSQILVKDLPVQDGVTITNEGGAVVATIALAKTETGDETTAFDTANTN